MAHEKHASLVRMANQISTFFEAQGEAKAVAGTRQHLKDYWDPRMLAGIQAYIAEGGTGLRPVALAALNEIFEQA